MRQRQELEIKDEVVGLLDLNPEWTDVEVEETEGFIGGCKAEVEEDGDLSSFQKDVCVFSF